MITTGYRIHRHDESLETIMDPRRPDGWTVHDESIDTQPLGVSCADGLDALAAWVDLYTPAIRPGDVLVRMEGTLGDDDRDDGAIRLVVESYDVLGSAVAWDRARRVDLDELAEDLDEDGEAGWAYHTGSDEYAAETRRLLEARLR